jgi:hypothetical protein
LKRTTGLEDQGLFSRLQSYFASSFGGRYVEHLVKETVEERPKLAQQVFGVPRFGGVQVEYRFRINGATRIADLVLFDRESQKPSCLIEIKYDDHKNPRNAAQLGDYLEYSRKTGCSFVYLTQHLPPEATRATLRQENRALLLFSDLADGLEQSENSVEGLLRRFFVDKGLVMHKFDAMDYGHLRSFLFRLFNPYGGQGRSHTKEGMSGGVADAFGDLLRNMNIIAREVTAEVVNQREPTIDFWAEPYVDKKRIQKEAGRDKHADITTSGSRAGGYLWIYARSSLGADRRHWLNVEYGLCLEVLAKDRNMYAYTYALVGSDLLREDDYETYTQKPAGLRIVFDKARAVRALKERLCEAISKAQRLRVLPNNLSRRLSDFRRAIS